MKLTREMNEDEKSEHKDLNEKTAEVLFIHRVGIETDNYTKNHKPFCRKCALEEFKIAKQSFYNEMKLRHNMDFTEKEKPFVDMVNNFDLAKYGKPEHFNMVGVERKNMRRREGGDVWFELVINTNYVCKPYNHGVCVSIAQSDMNEGELAREKKIIDDRKAKIAASASNEELPKAGIEKPSLPVGQHGIVAPIGK